MTTLHHLFTTLAVLAALAFTGCSQPVFDGTTDETLDDSYGEIIGSLSGDERSEFAVAYATVISNAAAIEADSGRPLNKVLHGMTADRLIAFAAAIDRKTAAEDDLKNVLATGDSLLASHDYAGALAAYTKAQAAGAQRDSLAATVADLQAMVDGAAHVPAVTLKVTHTLIMDNGKPGLRYTLTNTSDTALSRIRVKVIFCSTDGTEQAHEVYDPVTAAAPLAPGATWEMPTNVSWSPSIRMPKSWDYEKTRVKVLAVVAKSTD